MMMAGSGVDLVASLTPRIAAARRMIGWTKSIGMNSMGWRPQMSIRIYKTFIRPIMEYGIALAPLQHHTLESLQRVQNTALRCLFGVPRKPAPPQYTSSPTYQQ
ncbi:hypothetical protein BC829DRAFT_365221 [Chytridium lagenaria]|nr:hypothetical protein BC829DRAFT_365221 [Chytridium lagenaria]